jgi:NhaP-type Na+/H+ or K+/H+ antiporter
MVIYVFLLHIEIALLVGYSFAKLIKSLRFPAITGYILAGKFLGHLVLNFIASNILSNFNIILNVVLGIIAYQIGTELWLFVVQEVLEFF